MSGQRLRLATFAGMFLLTAVGQADNPSVQPEIPKELQAAPTYDRSTWLSHSLATADLVVVGTPSKSEDASLDVADVLHGKIELDLRVADTKVKLTPPHRFEWDQSGVWILLRTPTGYFSINPTVAPMRRDEWDRLAQGLTINQRPKRKLTEHVSKTQIHRTYRDEKTRRDVWHGANVWLSDGVYSESFKDGKRMFSRAWDRHGKLDFVTQVVDIEKGYFLDFHNGHLWRFIHYWNGKKAGVSRTFYQEKLSQMKEESYWHDGLRHGMTRTWEVNGKLTSDVLFEEGFIAPVIRYKGKDKSLAQIHKSEFGISYSAPHAIMDALTVGMTTPKVSNLLKLDFSERTGIRFDFYLPDTYLHISFKDGRITERKLGFNGNEVRPKDE